MPKDLKSLNTKIKRFTQKRKISASEPKPGNVSKLDNFHEGDIFLNLNAFPCLCQKTLFSVPL